MSELPSLSRIRWLCRRGTQELDRLLGEFAAQHYESLDDETRATFVALLETEDDQLWDWFIGRAAPPREDFEQLVQRIRDSR
ncbi:MAG: succinate dehydrogenase assembly factor 2 [Pseudomonadota bacterium]